MTSVFLKTRYMYGRLEDVDELYEDSPREGFV